MKENGKITEIEAKMLEKQAERVGIKVPPHQSNPIYSKFVKFIENKQKFSLRDIFK